jgi:quinol monooxygenase YgiN
MAAEVTVVATMKVKPEDEERALAILEGVIAASHGEEGCVKYTLHRATNQPGAFSIVEVWRSQEDLDAHFTEPHMAPIAEALRMLVEPPQILFCQPVAVGDADKGVLG